ncbi:MULTISPECIES: hypothetical protein [unclassified Microcoleus]|nr:MULTISPECIES: hypothetical protein [unclassified Microcoleus]
MGTWRGWEVRSLLGEVLFESIFLWGTGLREASTRYVVRAEDDCIDKKI